MSDKITGIYCIENIETKKKYIGQSVDIKHRWRQHINALNTNSHENDYLQKAWNKYGRDGFQFYILEECLSDMLDEKEIYYIEYYKTLDRDFGYNLKSGGQYCRSTPTDEVVKKMSESIRRSYEKNDLRQRRSECTKKYWEDPSNKERMLGENNVMFGKQHSEESKRKMSEVKKSKHNIPHNKNLKKVYCVELGIEYANASVAAKELLLDSGGIIKTCRGERHTCGGYHWYFVDDNTIGEII